MRTSRMAALIAAAILAATAAISGTPATATHSWGGYHWARTANPFTLKIGDNVSSTWDAYFNTANSQWTQSTLLDFAATTGGTSGKLCKATVGRVEVCNAAYGRTGWLGLASISITGGTHITQGTVKVNDTYFAMAQYDNPAERAHVMCQEIGHTLGLGHTSEDGTSQQTCMDYSQDPNSTAPNAHDYAELGSIYSHLDSTTTVGFNTGASSAQVGNDRATWGREVDRSANGDHSTFVRKQPDGTLIVTDVIWAN